MAGCVHPASAQALEMETAAAWAIGFGLDTSTDARSGVGRAAGAGRSTGAEKSGWGSKTHESADAQVGGEGSVVGTGDVVDLGRDRRPARVREYVGDGHQRREGAHRPGRLEPVSGGRRRVRVAGGEQTAEHHMVQGRVEVARQNTRW